MAPWSENGREGTFLESRNLSRKALEMDFSELKGRSYRCIDGCALCCLCQPELLPDEEAMFRSTPELAPYVAERHISPEVAGAALKLKGEHGSCCLLDDRRCRIYGKRPHYCRAFPVNVFVGWRIQLNANLSCRGIGLQGQSLEDIGREILERHGEAKLGAELASARSVFSQFIENCRSAKVSQSTTSVRDAGDLLSDELTSTMGLSRVMTYAEHGTIRQNTDAREIVKRIRMTEPEANVEERALIDGTELFDIADMSMLPVYVNKRLEWKIFKLEGKEIVGYDLEEDGNVREFSRTDPSDVYLLPMDSKALAVTQGYVSLVNRRDCFLGHAAYLCDEEDYQYNFAQVYLGALANNAVDLWWRSSLLAHLEGKSELGHDELQEGVVFFDMDFLDLPTIGAFI